MKGCQRITFCIQYPYSQSRLIEVFFRFFSVGIIFAAALTLVIVASVSADDDICQGLPDGKRFEDPEDCSMFYACRKNLSKRKPCMDDLLFDPATEKCLLPHKVTSCKNVIEKIALIELITNRIVISLVCLFHVETRLHE